MGIKSIIRQIIREYKVKRWTKIIRTTAKNCGDKLRVNYPSCVTPNTELGNNVNFNGMRILGYGKVVIGDNFHSGTNYKMLSSIHNYDNGTTIPYDSVMIPKDINIGDNVWFGDDVMILGGVTLGEGCIIQAGSVVVSDVPDCAIAGGHPARVFKYRDKDHYYSLKSQKAFM
ncbi:acetyltransferase [Desulfosporosinus sp. Tol-M]|nr:acetyltransferase [Desulfosporosinus sp. Tol-M]